MVFVLGAAGLHFAAASVEVRTVKTSLRALRSSNCALSARDLEGTELTDPAEPKTVFAFLRALIRGAIPAPRGRKTADPHAPYRRCPRCGERDLRLSDRQRAKPDVYRSRLFLLKWLCLSCGYRESETIEEIE